MSRIQVLLLVCAFFSVLNVSLGGYPSFLCPASPLNTTTFFPCDADCIYQHGAESGMCGPVSRSDYNCYCGRFTGHRVEQSLHCIARTGKFKQLCEVDCQCSHGAETGICDFDSKVCKCIGRDPRNTRCKFDTVEEFADFTAGIVPADSPAWYYLINFVKRPPLCTEPDNIITAAIKSDASATSTATATTAAVSTPKRTTRSPAQDEKLTPPPGYVELHH